MSSTCDLCGALEDERALQAWRDGWLCRSCDGLYSDEELDDGLMAEIAEGQS